MLPSQRKGETLLNLTLGILSLCAVTVTALVVRREFFPELFRASSPSAVPTEVRKWREFSLSGHRMGPLNAPVTIVVFSDFQCPYCAVLMTRLRELRSVNPEKVAVIYRHFPMSDHRHATAAAKAVECAAAQGRFEKFHNTLFSMQDSIGVTSWERFATMGGVPNLSAFQKCFASSDTMPAISRDMSAARALAVDVTPTFLINDLRFEGALPLDTLQSYVERTLRTKRQ